MSSLIFIPELHNRGIKSLRLLVFPSVQVSWKLVEKMLGLLMVEIQNRCVDRQWTAVAPIARSLQAMFELPDN